MAAEKTIVAMTVNYHQNRKTWFSLGKPTGKDDKFNPADRYWITPGENFIKDPAVCKALLANPEFQGSLEATKTQRARGQKLMGCEITSQVEGKEVKEGEVAPAASAPFAAVDEAEMAERIKGCSDVAQLEELKKTESRATLQVMISDRLEEIRKGNASEDADENGGQG